jgi:hypothetical protein
VAGISATLLGGIAGDRLRNRFAGSYFLVSGLGMLIGFPLFLAILFTPFPLAWLFVFLAVFWLFFNTGPTNTILANVTHPSVRASAYALNILVIHLFGDAFSPPMIGWLAGQARTYAAQNPNGEPWLIELLGRRDGMDFAFGVVSLTILAAGVLWLYGMRFLAEDTRLAPTRVAPRAEPA